MAMDRFEQPKLRILMFPWLAHGHIYPFIELAKRLSRITNWSIYVCSSAVNLDSIKTSIQKESSVELVQLHVPPLPQLPAELHTTKSLPSNLIPTLLCAFQMSSSSFSEILDSIKPDLLIYDLFQPWAPKLALSKDIPSVFFVIAGATPCSYYHHMYTNGTNSTFPYQAIHIPGHKIDDNLDQVTSLLKDAEKDFAFGNFTLSSDIVLVSSCRAVEEKYMDYLSLLSKKRIVPTGPLLGHDANANKHENEEHSEIMKWLSGKNEGCTVYISFGSECYLSKEQIVKIARGLQLCDANFIWVVRFPKEEKSTRNIEEELPGGFVETVKERGLIVHGWAPQMKILAHPNSGCFLCHCGWNSTTESMYFGVPIIALPMQYEQPITARLIVEAGVGIEVENESNGHNYPGEGIAKAINEVIECEEMRNRAKILSQKIKEEQKLEMDQVAEELLRICIKKGNKSE